MAKDNETKLKELGLIYTELEGDLQERIRVMEKLIRDANLGVDYLEEVQKLNMRMDRLRLREKGREVGDKLLDKLGSSLPDRSEVVQLRFIQTLLLNDIDVGKDSRLLDALVKAMEKLDTGPPAGEDVGDKSF